MDGDIWNIPKLALVIFPLLPSILIIPSGVPSSPDPEPIFSPIFIQPAGSEGDGAGSPLFGLDVLKTKVYSPLGIEVKA